MATGKPGRKENMWAAREREAGHLGMTTGSEGTICGPKLKEGGKGLGFGGRGGGG